MAKFDRDDKVKATLLDGNIKDADGVVLGSANNSDGECVYLVEMQGAADASYGRQTGTAQIEHGKKWVLSLYETEMRAAA